jgi:serine protease Do
MTRLTRILALAALTLPAVVAAQDVRIWRTPDAEERVVFTMGGDRPMIGVTTAQESDRSDTLGLLVEQVRRGSPADRAGLKDGDRIQRVNGVNLRADRADAGEEDYDGVLNRRLSREIEKTDSGKTVELVVLSEGRSRTLTVTPVPASELYGNSAGGYAFSSASDDRAVLGISTGATGSPRDTLGVFVSAVTTDGPADKAGIIEGDRIASINGVSLRVAREDAGDAQVSNARAERLRRELAKLDAGGVAELVVVTAGRSRTVRVTTVKASDLPGGGGFFGMVMPSLNRTPMPARAPRALMRSSAPTPPTPPVAPTPAVAGRLKSRVISL